MKATKLAIPDVVVLRPRRFTDTRGYFVETFNARAFREAIDASAFVQDNEALSVPKGTVRGLHFQAPPFAQGKLLRVIRGAIFDVAVDLRVDSSSFGRHVTVTLDADAGDQLWVPAGFAHGYCTLEPDTLIAYKVTNVYSAPHDGGILWNDPALGIAWPVAPEAATLSDKDRVLPRLADLPPVFTFAEAVLP